MEANAVIPRMGYYYWVADNQSYLLTDIKAHMVAEIARLDFTPDPNGFVTSKYIKTIANNSGLDLWLCKDITADKLVARLIENRSLIYDKAKNANDTVCPISLDEYNCPMIVNITGRSYSRTSIKEAVEKSLLLGNKLCLEDLNLEPQHIKALMLYPNKSLPNAGAWTVETLKPLSWSFSQVLKLPAFDSSKCTKLLPKFVHHLNQPDSDDMWGFLRAYEYYCQQYPGTPEVIDDTYIVENFVLSNETLFKNHPKMNSGKAIFRNVHFKYCDFELSCLCGPVFHSCCFDHCTITVKQPNHLNFKSTEFNDCTFKYTSDKINEKGLYNCKLSAYDSSLAAQLGTIRRETILIA